MWVRAFNRARRLLSEWTTYHGAHEVSVARNISSRAFEYSYQREYDLRSISDSFQILRPSSMRASSRLVCSSGLTSSQYFSRMTPDSTIAFSTPGVICRKYLTCSSVQKVLSRSVLEFDGAVSGRMRIRGQAARSIGLSASFWFRVCHPSTLRIAI